MHTRSLPPSTLIFVIIALLSAATDGIAQPVQRPAAPELELQTLDGDRLKLSEMRGDVVVLNFWATWCPPCRHEIPAFIQVQKKYEDKGLRIIGLSMDTAGTERVAEFAEEFGINYDIVMADADTVKRYGGIRTLPSTFIISRDGTLLARIPGMLNRSQLEQFVRQALE